MDIFDIISIRTFWRILLFLHSLVAVGMLATVTLQTVAALMPTQQTAGKFVDRFRPVPAESYTTAIIILYVTNFLLGVWIYAKYRTFVRIPMEQLGHWWTLGAFEFKEHIVAMGLGLLPAYWYFWHRPQSEEYASIRRYVTVFVAVSAWYAILSGHVANDFRVIGS
jgi:hypothetical protein